MTASLSLLYPFTCGFSDIKQSSGTKYLIDPPLWPNGILTFFLQAEKFITRYSIYIYTQPLINLDSTTKYMPISKI